MQDISSAYSLPRTGRFRISQDSPNPRPLSPVRSHVVPLSVKDMPSTIKDMPSTILKKIMAPLSVQDTLNFGTANKELHQLAKEKFFEETLTSLMEENNVTRPEGTPNDPGFIVEALRLSMLHINYRGNVSTDNMHDYIRAYRKYIGVTVESEPFFSIAEMQKEPRKAKEFQTLTPLFDLPIETLRLLRSVIKDSYQLGKHVEENPDIWGNMHHNRIADIDRLVHSSPENAAFVKENLTKLINTADVPMNITCELLLTAPNSERADFVRDNAERWFDLTAHQMMETFNALTENNFSNAPFVIDNTGAWLGFTGDQMNVTRFMLTSAGSRNAAFMKDNAGKWCDLTERQISITTDLLVTDPNPDNAFFIRDNAKAWLALTDTQMHVTGFLLKEAGADNAFFIRDNAKAWLALTEAQMEKSFYLLSRSVPENAAFIKNNKEMWFNLTEDQMNVTADILLNPTAPQNVALIRENIDSWQELTADKMRIVKKMLERYPNKIDFIKDHLDEWKNCKIEKIFEILRILNEPDRVKFINDHFDKPKTGSEDVTSMISHLHFAENPEIKALFDNHKEDWFKLSGAQVSVTQMFLFSDPIRSEYIRNHWDEWKKLSPKAMIEKGDELEKTIMISHLHFAENPEIKALFDNHKEDWFKLSKAQVSVTQMFLFSDPIRSEYIRNHWDEWKKLGPKAMIEKGNELEREARLNNPQAPV